MLIKFTSKSPEIKLFLFEENASATHMENNLRKQGYRFIAVNRGLISANEFEPREEGERNILSYDVGYLIALGAKLVDSSQNS